MLMLLGEHCTHRGIVKSSNIGNTMIGEQVAKLVVYQIAKSHAVATTHIVKPNLLVRGGWTHFKRYINILLLIAFFRLVFHVSLNSRNTKLKNDGVR